ncbi:metallophosphoesterase [Virgisporangium aurantiacum]|uniref:Metallophosphoesterase n=1 Tax=Virgisporangium aurantiacum TaxID=175570 RepID=A0A8J3YXN7_9ACTN|nr:metallophosphoesterase [Virgisporangium aurantiacum]GIJ53899.1 metallophosphoesterase [Virgisporangium aurantiacum]
MRLRTLAAGTVGLGLGVAAYASLVERNWYRLRRVVVPVLPPGAAPLRVLHLSDLHMTPAQTRKQRWVSSLASLEPDLVIVTGDNMASVSAVPAVLRAFSPLFEFPGAFVFGSNDYFGPVLKNPLGYLRRDRKHIEGPPLPAHDLRAGLLSAGWLELNNARGVLKAGGRAIELAGVDDPHIGRDRYVSAALEPSADLHFGVTHSPEPRVLDPMVADGLDLIFAGHTHGGQVCVPFYGALTTNCELPRRMARGLHRYGESWLHVSAGLGTHPTAPVRFACPPEASILTLVSR